VGGVMPSTVASAALYYAERRLPVFPVAPRAKRPRTAHGLKDATTDAAQITEWWRKSPDANIGAATGRASDLAVIDLDGPEGEASFAALEGPVEDMPVVLTGRGAHLHFRAPPFELRNSAGKIGPGVDIRADGGYVLLPPSVHPSGTVYQWIGKPRARPPWPEWLLCPAPTRPEPSPTRAWAALRDRRART
jgi:hypothetical protein